MDNALLRNCAVMLDTEAENLTDQLALTFGDQRKARELSERRATLWRAAKLLREIAK
jgi:hypothetical protein